MKKLLSQLIIILSFTLVLSACNKQHIQYALPTIGYCGTNETIEEGRLSKIWYVEESMCSLFKGEMFDSQEEAKTAYGTKVDFKQELSEQDIVTNNFTAYPGQTVAVGNKDITIDTVTFNDVQFDINGEKLTVPTNETKGYENLDMHVGFACGETYRTDFSVSEKLCCEEEEYEKSNAAGGSGEGEGDELYSGREDEDEMTRKAREESEEDLKAEGRSGYKGVILPPSVARDYPSYDFVIFPLTSGPDELCCGCRQYYTNLSWWGQFLTGEVRSGVISKFSELNSKLSEFEEDKYSVVDRSESSMRFALREINYIKQNEEYFEEGKKIPKGEWVNPDYVIEGSMNFKCCYGTEYVNVSFQAKIINAKTEKLIETLDYSPAQCFNLMIQPGALQAECTKFAKQIVNAVETRFAQK